MRPAALLPLVEARAVGKSYPGSVRNGPVLALSGIDLAIGRGEAVGLVGESGSGKSTLGRILAGLEAPSDGHVRFDGAPVVSRDGEAFRRQCGRIQYVFQDPLSALNPRLTIEQQVAEGLLAHDAPSYRAALVGARDFLAGVGLERPLSGRFPHQLSGGQRQRAVIARSLALRPDFVVLDEPVSALDLSIQAQILDLIGRLRAQFDLTILFISHDLRVVRYACDRIAVLHLGKVVESGEADAVFHAPRHPYTRALVAAIPKIAAADDRQPARRGNGGGG